MRNCQEMTGLTGVTEHKGERNDTKGARCGHRKNGGVVTVRKGS